MTAVALAPANTSIRRVPTILQLEAVECGAACLAMVLAHHGRHVPLEQLRVECGVSRDGSKASNLLHAARRHGLVAKGYSKELGDLQATRLPAIIFWNFNHFVVLEGFRAGKAHLNDPAQGRRIVDFDEFDRSFTGVVLTFEPGAEFKRGGNRPTAFKSLVQYFAGMKKAVALLVFLGLALALPGMVLPMLSSRFVDDVLVGRLDGMVMPLLAGMAVTALVRALLAWLQQRYLSHTQARSALQSASRFFWHALRLPAGFFTQRSAGEIASRVDLNERVAQTVSDDLSQMLLNLLTVSLFLVLMFHYDVQLTLIALGGVALELLLWGFISARAGELSLQMSVQAGRLAAASANGLTNIETIKASGQEAGLFSKWAGLQAQYLNLNVKAQEAELTLAQVPEVLGLLLNLSILAFGSLRIMDGHMTIGQLVAYQTLLAGFVGPAHALLALNHKIRTLTGDLTRLDDVLRHPAEDLQPAGRLPLHKLRGEIELRNVSFGYSPSSPNVVDRLSLHLRPGQRVALVGRSGSGKSTVSRLVAGLYRPSEGELLFDGRPREQYDRAAFAASLAIVDQEVFLFRGTVRDNLTMWDSTIADEDIVAACRDACIHDAIVSRSGGYEAPIEEAGRNLSGGQRQRLEIARALVRNPRILVLDEATSALDSTTERIIEENLRRRGCTCLIVAHRLSTVRDADEIILLDAGRVAERGTHDQLMRIDGGIYRQQALAGMQ